MFYAEDDIDTMLADSPHTITVGGVTRPCLFAEGDEVRLAQQQQGGQLVAQAVATVRTKDFPTVKGKDACAVTDGTTSVDFTVWERRKIQDGAVTELLLKNA